MIIHPLFPCWIFFFLGSRIPAFFVYLPKGLLRSSRSAILCIYNLFRWMDGWKKKKMETWVWMDSFYTTKWQAGHIRNIPKRELACYWVLQVPRFFSMWGECTGQLIAMLSFTHLSCYFFFLYNPILIPQVVCVLLLN